MSECNASSSPGPSPPTTRPPSATLGSRSSLSITALVFPIPMSVGSPFEQGQLRLHTGVMASFSRIAARLNNCHSTPTVDKEFREAIRPGRSHTSPPRPSRGRGGARRSSPGSRGPTPRGRRARRSRRGSGNPSRRSRSAPRASRRMWVGAGALVAHPRAPAAGGRRARPASAGRTAARAPSGAPRRLELHRPPKPTLIKS